MQCMQMPNPVGLKGAAAAAGEEDLLRALLCAGLFPAVAQVRQAKRPSFKTREDGKVEPHLTSVLGREGFFPHRWLVYNDKVCVRACPRVCVCVWCWLRVCTCACICMCVCVYVVLGARMPFSAGVQRWPPLQSFPVAAFCMHLCLSTNTPTSPSALQTYT